MAPPGLPKFLEVRGRVVFGVFRAERRVTSLMCHLRASIAAFNGLLKVEESLSLFVGCFNVCKVNAVVGQRKEPDVLERITHLLDKRSLRLG